MAQELFIALAVAALKIISALALSATALYTGMGLLDRLTHGIEEWKEIRKGNAAIGILLVSVMSSILLLVEPMIGDFVYSVRADLPFAFVGTLALISLINYVLALLGATMIIFLTINVIDRITMDVEEFKELKKGNVAVALVFAFSLLLITFALRQPFESLFDMLKSVESALLWN